MLGCSLSKPSKIDTSFQIGWISIHHHHHHQLFCCCWCNQISICQRLTYGSHNLNCHLDSSIKLFKSINCHQLISCFGWLVYSPFALIPCPTIDKQKPRLCFTLAIHCLLLLYSGSIASAKTKKKKLELNFEMAEHFDNWYWSNKSCWSWSGWSWLSRTGRTYVTSDPKISIGQN